MTSRLTIPAEEEGHYAEIEPRDTRVYVEGDKLVFRPPIRVMTKGITITITDMDY